MGISVRSGFVELFWLKKAVSNNGETNERTIAHDSHKTTQEGKAQMTTTTITEKITNFFALLGFCDPVQKPWKPAEVRGPEMMATGVTFRVPMDAEAEDLIAKAEEVFQQAGRPFSIILPSLLPIVRRDLEKIRGQRLREFSYDFNRNWTTAETRELQIRSRVYGNAAAFLISVTMTKPRGELVTIPNTDEGISRFETWAAPHYMQLEGWDRPGFFVSSSPYDGWNSTAKPMAYQEA